MIHGSPATNGTEVRQRVCRKRKSQMSRPMSGRLSIASVRKWERQLL